MKHTYIFKLSNTLNEDALARLVRVGSRVAVSMKYEGLLSGVSLVQFFTDANTMHEIAHVAGFSGQKLREEIPVARRNGDKAVQKASDSLRNRKLDAIDKKRAEAREQEFTDTERIDWLQKTGALVNIPNTGDGLAHLALGIDNHYYDKSYRAVIDRAIRSERAKEKQAMHGINYSEPIWSVDDGQVSHIDDRQFMKNLSRMTRRSKRSA